MAALAVLAATSAFAQTPDYVLDGIYPGMPAAQAKAAGFTACENSGTDEAICRRPQPTKEILGIPVKSISAIFETPYTAIKEVRIQFNTAKQDKACKATGGKWGDVIGPNCAYDVPAAITKAYGAPVQARYGGTWHHCGRYAMTYESGASLLHVIDTPDQIDRRKYECDQAQKRRAEQEESAKGSADFINRMK